MKKDRSLRSNNRGAAIAMTIVAVAVISVLALLALWIAYMNYYMKVTDMNATDNFYTAEGVVEQMRIGLQKELSDATGTAYKSVMQKYASMGESARKSTFLTAVENSLQTQLEDATDNTKYNMEKLCSYVYTPGYDDTGLSHLDPITGGYKIAINSDEARITTSSGRLEMDATAGTVILRDINVEYENARGYVSVVNTDFKIQVPTVNFGDVAVTTDLDLLKYVLIADQHLNSTAIGSVNVNGSVYGGNGDADVASTNPDKNNCITLDAGSKVVFGNSPSATSDGYDDLVISGKIIKMNGASEMTTKDNTELWTSDFVLGGKNDNGQKLTLTGKKAYVADDLSIDGKDDEVTLANAYYGFGSGLSENEDEDVDDRSAILLNGKNTTLNLSGLTELWLGGRAYVGTRKIDLPEGLDVLKNKNIPMADSIAIRGNQIAYLVPGEALAVNRNPMTRTDYEKYVVPNLDKADFNECDLGHTLVPGTDALAGKYLSNYVSPIRPFQKIFAPGLNGEYLVYYYMVMSSPESANLYFEDYYGVPKNKETLDKYAKYYLAQDMGLKASADADWNRVEGALGLAMNGDWMTLDDDPMGGDPTVNLHKASDLKDYNNSTDPDFEDKVDQEAILNPPRFEKLVTNLSKTLPPSYGDRVFDNIVIRDEVEDFMVGTYSVEFMTSDGYKAIVSNGDVDHPGGKVVFIITTGNVNITGNVKGTVISAGNINITNGCTIETDDDTKSAIMKLLRKSAGSGTKSRFLWEFLRDGEKFAESEDAVDDMESITDMNELVNYENWSKR